MGCVSTDPYNWLGVPYSISTAKVELLDVSIGPCIEDLEIIAKAAEPEDLSNRVEYLPL